MFILRVFAGFLSVVLYVLFGFLIFTVSTLLLVQKDISERQQKPAMVTTADSCSFDASTQIMDLCQGGGVMVYLESQSCASCTSKALKPITDFLIDSIGLEKPVLVYHMKSDSDLTKIDEYHEWFGDSYNVIVSSDDSIRIKNDWMMFSTGVWGFVTDSLNRVEYGGFLYADQFFETCKNHFDPI